MTKHRSSVLFSVRGLDLIPADVGRALSVDVQTDNSHARGDTFALEDGSTGTREDGYFSFLTQRVVDPSSPLTNHVDWMLDRLEPQSSVLADWRSRGWHMRLSAIVVTTVNVSARETLDPNCLARLARLALPLELKMRAEN